VWKVVMKTRRLIIYETLCRNLKP